MKSQMKTYLLLAVVAVLIIAGCTAKQEVVYLSSTESAGVATLTDPAANNIINAIATNNYELFIMDFDEKMRESLSVDQFASIVKMYGKNGPAKSILLLNIEDREPFYAANYGVTYKKDAVTMTIVVSKTDPGLVSGLWFK